MSEPHVWTAEKGRRYSTEAQHPANAITALLNTGDNQ